MISLSRQTLGIYVENEGFESKEFEVAYCIEEVFKKLSKEVRKVTVNPSGNEVTQTASLLIAIKS
jgi:hypothetical protein